jgi:acetyl esterase/lipase
VSSPVDPSARYLSVDDYLSLPRTPADHRIPYGEDPAQFGDLYLPAGEGPHPLAVVIHGGCWSAQYDLHPLGSMCDVLRGQGLAVWNLEYRRLGNGGGWPTTFLDVGAGVDFLRTLADRFALDLERFVAVGHSAGGHLALWLAGRHRLPAKSLLYVADPLPAMGVVGLAAIPDLAAGLHWNLCGTACADLVGGLPVEEPNRYQQASPVELLPLGIPQWHLVGSRDELVPSAYLEAHVAVAKQHDPVRLEILSRSAHFEVVFPGADVWPSVQNAILSLSRGETFEG